MLQGFHTRVQPIFPSTTHGRFTGGRGSPAAREWLPIVYATYNLVVPSLSVPGVQPGSCRDCVCFPTPAEHYRIHYTAHTPPAQQRWIFLSWKKSGCISMLLYRRGNNNESVWSDDSCTWSHLMEWIVSLFGALDVAWRRRVIVAHRVVKELPIENTVWFWGSIGVTCKAAVGGVTAGWKALKGRVTAPLTDGCITDGSSHHTPLGGQFNTNWSLT